MEPTDEHWWDSMEDPSPPVGCAPWLLILALTIGMFFAFVTTVDGTTYPRTSGGLMVAVMWVLVLAISRYWWRGNHREAAKALLIGMAILSLLFGHCATQLM